MIKLSTKFKIGLASVLYRIIHCLRECAGKDDLVHIMRGGISWHLDLKEGIDLSVFLFGGFERGTQHLYNKILGENAGEVVFDIGANIGAHTLPLARSVVPRGGVVYAFEPTRWAYDKLLRNIGSNPEIQGGIHPVQAMLTAEDGTVLPRDIYSSWPLTGRTGLHKQHGGQMRSTDGAQSFALDHFVKANNIGRIDFIKLDVDGNEAAVLSGAMKSIVHFRPAIILEWSPGLFSDNSLHQAVMKILDLHYGLFDGYSGKPIHGGIRHLDRITPSKGSRNILLRPKSTIRDPEGKSGNDPDQPLQHR